MPRYLESSRVTDLVNTIPDPTTPVLNGEIIDGPPPQTALVPVKVVDGTFTADESLPPFDFSFSIGQPFDEEETKSPSSREKNKFRLGIPNGLTDEQLTYRPGPASKVIGGICRALGELLRPKERRDPSSSTAIVPHGGATVTPPFGSSS